ncbi:ead/Ea22-like family protein [Escherichia coli]|nr:ead/Ea22-like family protein [Escherichia coli]
MSKIDYQALREAAESASKINWTGLEDDLNADGYMRTLTRYIQCHSPIITLSLLDERDALNERIAELEKQCAEWERKALSNFEECAAMAERIEELQAKSAPDSFGIIGENIRTQDNRITSDPMFCVYQKREIVVDADYDYDRIVWVDEDGNEANKRQSRRLELLHENFREPPEKWRRVAVKDIDEFVTCCFTEQGCKDYLAANGHNLRLPFIYVKSGFRNAEYIGIRNWLAGIRIKGE